MALAISDYDATRSLFTWIDDSGVMIAQKLIDKDSDEYLKLTYRPL